MTAVYLHQTRVVQVAVVGERNAAARFSFQVAVRQHPHCKSRRFAPIVDSTRNRSKRSLHGADPELGLGRYLNFGQGQVYVEVYVPSNKNGVLHRKFA